MVFRLEVSLWATLFGSQATLETNLVYAGQYKYHKGFFNLTIERKWVFRSMFSKLKVTIRGAFLMFYQNIKMFAGRMWPAG